MRVLMLSTNYHPIIGGAESYCRDLATGLARSGHDVTVFTDGSALRYPTVVLEGGVRVVRERSYLERLSDPDVSTWEQMAFSLLPAITHFVRDRLRAAMTVGRGLSGWALCPYGAGGDAVDGLRGGRATPIEFHVLAGRWRCRGV